MPLTRKFLIATIGTLATFALVTGCTIHGPQGGGAQARYSGQRRLNPADIWLPPGYKIEPVIQGLNFPTGVTFDDQGHVFVVESGYSYGEIWTEPRLVLVAAKDVINVVARGTNGPWTGATYKDGNFYIAEGGQALGGRIIKVTAKDGATTTLVDDLPSTGDHHTNAPVIGPDGYVYFGQGTATNSGVVGVDNFQYGWLRRYPAFHDIPARDVTLAGVNYESIDPFSPSNRKWYQNIIPWVGPRRKLVLTGAYQSFGTASRPGEVVHGQVPFTGGIMRVPADGGKVEMVAWGMRNPFGLAFSPDGKLYTTENQADVRGSRPVWGVGDMLWEVKPGTWYGWPDYVAGQPVNNDRFSPPEGPMPRKLLARRPGDPPKPVAEFGAHASADGMDFSRDSSFGHVGEAFVAEFGDLAPVTGTVQNPVGFRVVRVETAGGIIHPFAVNKGRLDAPASKIDGGGLERPIAAKFDPSGKALYVVDYGVMLADQNGIHPAENTGVLWKITRESGK
jgi:glucose/arabinose dehydrogenase